MRKMGTSNSKKNLAARAFDNFYFVIAWILFLIVVLRLVEPLRKAWLVIWVFGSDGYFRQGIRVANGKPTTFSNGEASPPLPNMVTGFGTFLITVLGLTFLLFCVLRLYDRFFGRR